MTDQPSNAEPCLNYGVQLYGPLHRVFMASCGEDEHIVVGGNAWAFVKPETQERFASFVKVPQEMSGIDKAAKVFMNATYEDRHKWDNVSDEFRDLTRKGIRALIEYAPAEPTPPPMQGYTASVLHQAYHDAKDCEDIHLFYAGKCRIKITYEQLTEIVNAVMPQHGYATQPIKPYYEEWPDHMQHGKKAAVLASGMNKIEADAPLIGEKPSNGQLRRVGIRAEASPEVKLPRRNPAGYYESAKLQIDATNTGNFIPKFMGYRFEEKGITADQAREAAHVLNQLAEYLDDQKSNSNGL